MSFSRFLTPIVLLTVLFWLPVRAEEVRLFLLHTNDIHGHLEQEKGNDPTGGFVRLATVARAIEASFPGQVVMLDAGDTALGTPISGLYKGIPTALSRQSLNYDVIALGNHEFDWGQQALAEMMTTTGAKVVCANIVNEKDGKHPYPASTVIERNGVRLGIIGLVAPDTPTRTLKSNTAGWVFQEAEPAAAKAISKLPEVDCVIALTHIGVEADKKLAASVPGINLIVGGHSHTPLQEVVVENSVPIVQSGCYSHFLGVLEVMIDTERKSLKVMSYHLVPIDESIAPDPAVSKIVESYAVKVNKVLDRKVGEAPAPIFNFPDLNSVDTALGDTIADMLAEESKADIAFYNRGGVRGQMPAGTIDVRKLHEMFPFDDPVVVVEANASQLEAVVKQGVTARAQLSPSKNLQVQVLKDGSVKLKFKGKPLEPNKTYRLAVTNFIASGGDNMPSFKGLKVIQTLPYIRDVLISRLDKNPNIVAPAQRRVERITIYPR